MLKKLLSEQTPIGRDIKVDGHKVLLYSGGFPETRIGPYTGIVQCTDLKDYLDSYQAVCEAIERQKKDLRGKSKLGKLSALLLNPTDDHLIGRISQYGFEIPYVYLGEDHDTIKEIRIPGIVGYHPTLVQGNLRLNCTYGLACLDDLFKVGDCVRVLGEPISGKDLESQFDIQIMERADD